MIQIMACRLLFVAKINKAETVARQITSGRIWINNSISKSHPSLPIEFKESGFNRECGLEGFRTYTEIKSIIT